MANFKCGSCGGTYSDTNQDGSLYFHQCSPEVVTPATFDATGKIATPEKRTARPNPRDENLLPNLEFDAGKYFTQFRDKNDPAIQTRVETPDPMRHEGAGRAPA